ncbi:hypothetical protein GQ44DRAFT_442307 [Phaeosphaeriaceae sp. PMI808]|nr:hypothetical protein GQ44DRAFT_442307 [Phaeosphaeriaceae sp. PMI808]
MALYLVAVSSAPVILCLFVECAKHSHKPDSHTLCLKLSKSGVSFDWKYQLGWRRCMISRATVVVRLIRLPYLRARPQGLTRRPRSCCR